MHTHSNRAEYSGSINISREGLETMRRTIDEIAKRLEAEAREASKRTGLPVEACRLMLSGQRVPILEDDYFADGEVRWAATGCDDGFIPRGYLVASSLWLTRFRFDMWMARLEREGRARGTKR